MKKFESIKSIYAVMLCFIMIFSLCACTESETLSSDADNTSLSSLTSPTDSSAENTDNVEDTVTSQEGDTIDNSPKDEETPTTSSSTSTPSSSSSKPEENPTISIEPFNPLTSSTPAPTQKTAKELVVGKWQGSVDMAPMFSEEMGFEFKGPATVWCDMEFTSGGVVYEIINRVSLTEAYFNVYSEWLNNSLTEEGLTKEQFETSVGMSFDEYVNTLVEASMQIVPLTATHSYKFEGNDLYVRQQGESDFEKEEYSFDGDDKLILNQDGVNVTYTRKK